jgi:hypothetical protein
MTLNREYPVEWVIRELERNGFEVDDVRMFPISWGLKALQLQLETCDFKIKAVSSKLPSTHYTLTHSMIEELQFQMRSLSNMLNNNAQIKQIGACYGMDYVVAAHKL